MQHLRRLTSGVLVGAVTMAISTFVALPAQSETRDGATPTHVRQVDSQVEPLAAANCVGYLSGSGYTVTAPRLAACVTGSLPTPTAIPACTVALVLTGVRLGVSATACTLAAIP